MSCHRVVKPSILLSGLILVGCVSPAQFDTEMNSMRRELRDTQAQLDDANRRGARLEANLADLGMLSQQVETNNTVQLGLLNRVEQLEGATLTDLSRQLDEQSNRMRALAADLESLSKLPAMETIIRLDQGLQDLDGQVEENTRLSRANRDSISDVTHQLGRHEIEFNRQMQLLESYVEEQFAPLAKGLVEHIYEESRRLATSAQTLEDFARKVDPNKFTHLQPRFADGTEKAQDGTNGETKQPAPKNDG